MKIESNDVMWKIAVAMGNSMDANTNAADVAGKKVELDADLKSLRDQIEGARARLETLLATDPTGLPKEQVETLTKNISRMQQQIQVLNVMCGSKKDRNTKGMTEMSTDEDLLQALEKAFSALQELLLKGLNKR